MHRLLLAILCVAGLFYAPESALSQEGVEGVLPRVGLLSPSNGESRTDGVLGSVVEDTIELALLQLGGYEFVPPEELTPLLSAGGSDGTLDPADVAREAGLEFVLIQRLGTAGDQSTVTLELYDAVSQGYAGTHVGRFSSTLEVFDAADEAILGALGELAGTDVAFGSLRLEVSGDPRPYTVVLGDARYDGSPRRLSRLLTGSYPFEAVTAEGFVVSNREVSIQEGEVTRLTLDFPGLFPEEFRSIRATYRAEVARGIAELVPGLSRVENPGEGDDAARELESLQSAPEIPGLRGVPRGAGTLEALRRGEGRSGWIGAPSPGYRQLSASELHERIPSIGRSTEGAIATLAREVTVPSNHAVQIDGVGSEWNDAEPFFTDPPVTWLGRVGFSNHTGQLMMLFEIPEREVLRGDVTNFTLIFSGTGGKELSLEFRSDQETASVGTSTWTIRGAYLEVGDAALEIAIPKTALARQFEPQEQLRLRLRAEMISDSGTLASRDTGFQGALMPLLEE